jgi:hypothetical protein
MDTLLLEICTYGTAPTLSGTTSGKFKVRQVLLDQLALRARLQVRQEQLDQPVRQALSLVQLDQLVLPAQLVQLARPVQQAQVDRLDQQDHSHYQTQHRQHLLIQVTLGLTQTQEKFMCIMTLSGLKLVPHRLDRQALLVLLEQTQQQLVQLVRKA